MASSARAISFAIHSIAQAKVVAVVICAPNRGARRLFGRDDSTRLIALCEVRPPDFTDGRNPVRGHTQTSARLVPGCVVYHKPEVRSQCSRIITDGWRGYDNLSAQGHHHERRLNLSEVDTPVPEETNKESPSCRALLHNSDHAGGGVESLSVRRRGATWTGREAGV